MVDLAPQTAIRSLDNGDNDDLSGWNRVPQTDVLFGDCKDMGVS